MKEILPPGIRLLSDKERIEILNNLIVTRNEIEDVLNRMPIGNQSFGILKRKSELEMKIWEFNNAIDTFSHPKVYITI